MSADPQPTSDNQTHPWRRFLARHVDYSLFGISLLGPLFIAFPELDQLWPESSLASIATQAVLATLWILPESFFISTFRTTPGKWIFGISVQSPSGEPLSFSAAFKRSAKVWAFGCAYGIYPISLLAFRNAYKALEARGSTSWDQDTEIAHRPPRKAAVACAIGGLISLNLIALVPESEFGATIEEQSAAMVEAEIDAVAKDLTDLYAENGLALDSSSPRMVQLADGEVHERVERLERGGSVIIAGGCDQDCSDLDLIVFDPEGNEVDRDKLPDDRPYVYLEPELTGDYRVVLTMHSCATEWCMGGFKLLRSDGLIPATTAGEGTGFIVDSNGSILTADHVVSDAASLTIVFPDGSKREATVERRSPANDMALLRVKVPTPHYLPIAEPRSAKVGDQVFVMGFPITDILGSEAKFTEGSITALSGVNGESADFQMSVPIQPGSSGSPVINELGQVVGIATSSLVDQELLEDGAIPQLVNWATKAEIALTLVGVRDGSSWTASSRSEAISRARSATVRVLTSSNQ